MPLLGQASGGWTESSSALRLLNVGIRNSVGVLADDAFTQTNPPCVSTAGTISTRVDVTRVGVLSGSVALTRPDAGENHIGGMTAAALAVLRANIAYQHSVRPLGLFINSANGNPYENTPGVASGIGPYVSAMGTYATALYETAILLTPTAGDPLEGAAIVYYAGGELMASRNAYLMPQWNLNTAGNGLVNLAQTSISTPILEPNVRSAIGVVDTIATGVSTVIGILKMAPDSVQTELVFDQRI